jgi:hypothetical protein
MEKITVSELEEMIRSKFLEKGASIDEIKEEVIKNITEKIKNKSKEGKKIDTENNEEKVLNVDISKPKDEEGKVPESITSTLETSKEMEDILKREEELKRKEEELSRIEIELNDKETILLSKEEELKHHPEIPKQLKKLESEKLFIFDENEISVGSEKLSSIYLKTLENPEEKTNMKDIWLNKGVKEAELYIVKFEKIGKLEFDPFEGNTEFIEDILENKEDDLELSDIELDSQSNMKDSIKPIKDVTQPMINNSFDNINSYEENIQNKETEEEEEENHYDMILTKKVEEIIKKYLQ